MRQFFADEERQEFAIWVSLLVSEYCKTQIYTLLAFPMGCFTALKPHNENPPAE